MYRPRIGITIASRAVLSVCLLLSLTRGGIAERRYHTIGGSGRSWVQSAQHWVALDDTTTPGAIQPKELKPWENIFLSQSPERNIFGFEWHFVKRDLSSSVRSTGI